MTITNNYLVVESLVADVRAAIGAGVPVFDSLPSVYNDGDFDALFQVTLESVPLAYFWVLGLEELAVAPHGTQSQRQSDGGNLYGYMIRSDRPGAATSDPKISAPLASGVATGGSTSTLADTGVTFGAYANTHECWVTFGSGRLDHRRILSSTATQLTFRQAFDSVIGAGLAYAIHLRPTEWLLHEQARALVDRLTTKRSAGGLVITSPLTGYRMEPVMLYERGFWRATIPFSRTDVVNKNYQ